MDIRRRSTRIQAKNAVQPETDQVKVSIRKRNSDESVDAPPKTKKRQSAVNTSNKKEGKAQIKTKKPPVESNEEIQKEEEPNQQSLKTDRILSPLTESSKDEDNSLKVKRKESTSSLETFDKSSDDEEVIAQQKLSRPPSRNNPRRSCAVSTYKLNERNTSSSSESDFESLDSDGSVFDLHEEANEKQRMKRVKGLAQKRHAKSTEESSDEEDIEDDIDEELEEIKPKKKAPSKMNRNKKESTAKSIRSNAAVKTLANQSSKTLERERAKLLGNDIVVPPRKLRRGEQKMLVFRILARQLAVERDKEIDVSEGYRLLDQIKAEFEADKEGYMRRVLLTGGRDPDEELAKDKKDESKKEDDNSSSSEDEWLEMEPVEAANEKKLEVTVENNDATGYDWWAVYLRQEVNKQIRKKWETVYKTHILCYLAHLLCTAKATLHENLIPQLMVSQLPDIFFEQQESSMSNSQAHKMAIWYISNFKAAKDPVIINSDVKKEHPYEETGRYATLASIKCFETDLERAVLLFATFAGLEVSTRICVNTRLISRRWDEDKEKISQKKKAVKVKPETTEEVPKKKAKKEKKELEIMDYWVEFWETKEKRWICVDPISGDVDKPAEIEKRLNKPISYIFAIDNRKGIRDISARYASDFCTPQFRRRRINTEKWLESTLQSYIILCNQDRAKLEDLHFQTEMLKRPLPNTLGEYKNHPLYALEKDLLKFQAIYPPPSEQIPLGEIRGHKVYPRETIHTLLGIKKWEKMARSIKEGEEPYKIVKAIQNPMIPKEKRSEKWLDVYGFWQTEPFRPPICENGIIPRNEHGNVYLYQKTMCPVGAVHLPLPGLVQIARRLNKECVPAVVGWDFNHCGNWPVIEGACVLEKDKDIFIEEWKKDEANKVARQKKKIAERATKNWKKFIQGMLRLNRIQNKFGKTEEQKKGAKKEKKDTTKAGPSIIDNTQMPKMKEFTLNDVMGI